MSRESNNNTHGSNPGYNYNRESVIIPDTVKTQSISSMYSLILYLRKCKKRLVVYKP